MIPQEYFAKIKKYFDGDTTKAWMWFKIPNPCFGMLSAHEMILRGREKKVKDFIDNAMDDDKRFYP